MAHPYWCGKTCADCEEYCKLDESMSCSPDCEGLDGNTGKRKKKHCVGCDAVITVNSL